MSITIASDGATLNGNKLLAVDGVGHWRRPKGGADVHRPSGFQRLGVMGRDGTIKRARPDQILRHQHPAVVRVGSTVLHSWRVGAYVYRRDRASLSAGARVSPTKDNHTRRNVLRGGLYGLKLRAAFLSGTCLLYTSDAADE